MVKTLKPYVNRNDLYYRGSDGSCSGLKIILEKDFYGNLMYFGLIREAGKEKKERIYLTGKERVILFGGTFVKAKDNLARRLRGRTMVKL